MCSPPTISGSFPSQGKAKTGYMYVRRRGHNSSDQNGHYLDMTSGHSQAFGMDSGHEMIEMAVDSFTDNVATGTDTCADGGGDCGGDGEEAIKLEVP
ncbi:hypothetical protein HDE_12067 [Halotydeus destructor]|nr:hypothetical protein HDE_12067 [Halotydeus destructor]